MIIIIAIVTEPSLEIRESQRMTVVIIPGREAGFAVTTPVHLTTFYLLSNAERDSMRTQKIEIMDRGDIKG